MVEIEPGGEQRRTSQQPEGGDPLTQRINRIFLLRARLDGRKAYSPKELSELILKKTGMEISDTQVRNLQSGKNTNPTRRTLEALAKLVPVRKLGPAYFLDDDVAERFDAQLALALAMKEAGASSLAAFGAEDLAELDGLPPETLRTVARLLERTSQAQRLGDASGPEPTNPASGQVEP